MNEYLQKIDEGLKPFFQKKIRLLINDQQYKEGRFILYTHGYFSLNLEVENAKKKKTEVIKIPLPFECEYYPDESLLYFDYRIQSFTKEYKILEALIRKMTAPSLSRYYDKIVTIEVSQWVRNYTHLAL